MTEHSCRLFYLKIVQNFILHTENSYYINNIRSIYLKFKNHYNKKLNFTKIEY